MRILLAHNAYQHRGGEDMAVESEAALLRAHGHDVTEYRRDNREITGIPKVALAADTLWSRRTLYEVGRIVADFRPDVIHAHNTFPLISPALYWAAGRADIPVVQTLHNFRMLCPQAMFLRDGQVCEDCLGKLPWRAVVRRCYRGSIVQSAMVGGMLGLHQSLGTYCNKVTRYIALNEFCRRKFIDGGLPAERIVVKPNFVDVPHVDDGLRQGGLFVGRLSAEKGIGVLIRAMSQLPTVQLDVIGSGPEDGALDSHRNIHRLGFLPRPDIIRRMQKAAYLLMPSIWYENFPLTIVEALACGLPVIASRLGAMAELIEDGRTGLLFEPGSANDLAQKLAWAEANPDAMMEMGKRARNDYEAKYTPERNFKILTGIYMDSIDAHSNGVGRGYRWSESRGRE
jgi:glycosyltransferase involved in cell wall biosynthesis